MLATLPLLVALVVQPAPQSEDETLVRELDFQTGTVDVGRDLATMTLPEGWSYLQADDARFVVEEVWGNPEDRSVIGFVAPPDDQDTGWGVIVSYEDDGHVDDSDAASIDYDELLDEMRDDARAAADRRRAEGYPTAELLGWAEAPHYDSAGKKLYWAQRLQFSGEPEPTLNYNVRILGREGVLVLNAVAGVDELDVVSEGCKALLAGTEFVEGRRYEDFDPSTDRLAAYGIGGLIAGKLLLKGGLLAKLGLFFAKGWKVVVLAVVAIGGFAKKLLGGDRRAEA